MEYASVKIYKGTLKKAQKLKGKLMQEEGERKTDAEVFEKALEVAGRHEKEFLAPEKGNWEEIKKFAGSWKLSEKEARALIDEMHERRKSWRNFA